MYVWREKKKSDQLFKCKDLLSMVLPYQFKEIMGLFFLSETQFFKNVL